MRRALKILFAFVVLVVVALTAAVFLIPRERIVALAADQVRAATGRELVLTGDVSPSFWPVLGVRTGALRLSNADWAEAADMVSASAAEIGVELVPLFSGEVRVTTLRLVDPVVALEIGADGRPNWEFGEGAGARHDGGGAGGMPRIALPEAVITNGSLSFHDVRTGQRIALAALDLTAGLAGMDAPLKLDGSGRWNGERAELSALVDTPAAAMEGRPVKVRLSLASDPATVGFDGEVKLAENAALPLVSGAVSAKLTSPAAAVAWATGAKAPDGLDDIGEMTLDGTITAAEAALNLAAKGSAGYKGRVVAFDLKADGGAGWLDRQAITVALAARAEGLFNLSFSGPVAAGAAPSAEGPLTVSVADLRGLAEWASGAALDTPAGSFETAEIGTRLALTGGDRLDFSGLTMRIDSTTLTGQAGVDLGGARPLVTARLESGPLDLSPFMAGGGAQAPGGGGGATGWSTEPLDFSALRAVDADVAIRAEAVDLGQIEIGRSDIDARLRGGRLDMNIRRVDAYGGGMNGTVVLEAGEETRIATDLTISQVQLRPLLNALAGFDRLEGLGAFRIRVDGHGRSMDALMRSLDGQGGLDLTDGAILGLNLAAMVRNLTGQGGGVQKTDFTAVTGSFDITGGVLHNTDFSFLGPLLRVVGAGTVDLGSQAQNFRLEPTAVASLTGQGGTLADSGLGVFPIMITGTWSNPNIRPDLTAAVQDLLADPGKTVETVTGLVMNADPGKAAGALIGTITGGAEQGGPAGALGQTLGGLLGGGRAPSGGGSAGDAPAQDGTTAQPGFGGGGLLGALGGGRTGEESTGQPRATDGGAGDAAPEFDASEFAPARAPLPRPAAPGRAALASLPGGAPSPAPATDSAAPEPPPAAAPVMPSAPGAETPPAPEASEAPVREAAPAAAPESAPEPAPEPDSTGAGPQPAPATTEEAGALDRPKRADGDGEARPKGSRDKDGGLTPDQILKSLQK
jgi:AsmA protein